MEKMQNQSVQFVLSTDAKPRLKWTPLLHQRFIDAVNQLGGSEKATPKSLMKVMGIPGLTLYHLKSHLQKYRLGKRQLLEICSDNKHEDYREIKSSSSSDGGHCCKENSVGSQKQITTTEKMEISHALQMQMEVQRKLYEQIEVQKHLQLKIEAQGKYLQSVLKKAQESLSGYNSSIIGLDFTKSELSQLVTMINNACPSSPISEVTENRGFFSLRSSEKMKQDKGTMCSLESSLTSSESSERKEEIENMKNSNNVSLELPLMEIHTEAQESNGRKRSALSGNGDSEDSCVDQSYGKRSCVKNLRKPGLSEMLDLNGEYHSDMDSSTKKRQKDIGLKLQFKLLGTMKI